MVCGPSAVVSSNEIWHACCQLEIQGSLEGSRLADVPSAFVTQNAVSWLSMVNTHVTVPALAASGKEAASAKCSIRTIPVGCEALADPPFFFA